MTSDDFPVVTTAGMMLMFAIGFITWRSRGVEEAIRNAVITSLTLSLAVIIAGGIL